MLEDYAGVVYDLDGTLVRLEVAWDAVRTDAAAAYRDAGVDPESRDLWALMADADANGLGEAVETVISRHERDGARTSTRLPLADALAPETRPVGVCTLNCEAAAYVALDVHDVADHVDAVVGRDTVANHKPHPEPLLATVDRLALAPDDVVFVGDSERDAETADAAGTAFAWADDLHAADR
ncbi:HAD-IA family hydrolase [Halorubellus sp. PRR65]|uniref:HAD family hydrolase n=1 Tax=Halorubellus sp. PRR65 TaxID=3098148 RepID=UPI002B25D83A|nr:HAD-IA family hydrolase [Halorubellus sp. PRR65]